MLVYARTRLNYRKPFCHKCTEMDNDTWKQQNGREVQLLQYYVSCLLLLQNNNGQKPVKLSIWAAFFYMIVYQQWLSGWAIDNANNYQFDCCSILKLNNIVNRWQIVDCILFDSQNQCFFLREICRSTGGNKYENTLKLYFLSNINSLVGYSTKLWNNS